MPGKRHSILVVEDEPVVAEVVERYLLREGHDVCVVQDGLAALDAFAERDPDLIVLDLMLPGLDGIEVCRRVRASSRTPIIMLTARGEESDKLLGLDEGTDDYLTKPFSPRELVARVSAVLHRTTGSVEPRALRFDDPEIDGRARTVEVPGALVLTSRDFDLLYHMAGHARQVFSREQLLDAIWDHEFTGDPTTATVHMRRLRAKLEVDPSRPRHLKTVWGVGYKFEP